MIKIEAAIRLVAGSKLNSPAWQATYKDLIDAGMPREPDDDFLEGVEVPIRVAKKVIAKLVAKGYTVKDSAKHKSGATQHWYEAAGKATVYVESDGTENSLVLIE